MNSRRRINLSPRMLLLLLTGICIVLLFLSAAFKNVFKPFTNVVAAVVIPMQDGINTIGSWAGDRFGNFKTMKELQEENERLSEQVQSLEEANQSLRQKEQELSQLQELLTLDESYGDYKKVGARIISKGGGNWFEVFVINKGSKDGIKKDMNVISGNGLVGIVIDVGRNYAKVRSIVDDNSNVSAMSVKSRDTCVVQGDSQSMEKNGTVNVAYISKDAKMQAGEELVTSHISSKYLPGIRIGTVSDIKKDSSNLTQSSKLTPYVDFAHLEQVLVITDLKNVPEDAESTD